MPSIRILVVDDHRMFRQGVVSLLEDQSDFEVIGEASDGREAVTVARQLQPDVVVMDVSMPDMNGIEATRKILESGRSTRVIALSMHTDRRFVDGMLEVGAAGYVLKSSAFEELVQAVRAVMADQRYLCPAATRTVVDGYVAGTAAPNTNSATLSPRERETLQLIAEGKSTREISELLEISPKTVETHRKNLMHKLDIDNIAELTKFAIREGLTTLEN